MAQFGGSDYAAACAGIILSDPSFKNLLPIKHQCPVKLILEACRYALVMFQALNL